MPGHGVPTDMAEVTRYTRDYLVYMRAQIGALIRDGGGLEDVSSIDQSAYSHLDTRRTRQAQCQPDISRDGFE